MGRADPAAGVRLGTRTPAAAGGHTRLEWLSDGLLVSLPPLVGGVMALAGGFNGPYWPMVVLTLTESFVLAWYRRFPLAVLGVVTGLEFVLAALDIPVFVGILVAATGLGAWGRPRQQRIGIGIVLGTLLTAGVLSMFLKDGEPLVVALVFTIVAILIIGFVAIGRAGARQRTRIQELREHSQRLEAEHEVAGQLAAERERALLARELHDILNHAVTAMVLDAEVAADTGKDTEVTLRRVASTGRESLAELRRLLGVLRDPPDGHDPLAVPPRLDQLEELVRAAKGRLERCGEVRPVDASIELAVYRVVQESLTNVAKHAGEVEAEVVLSYAPDSLSVRISNPAPASSPRVPEGAGLGLIGMRERVELLGGSLRAGARTGGGFEVSAELPLRSTA